MPSMHLTPIVITVLAMGTFQGKARRSSLLRTTSVFRPSGIVRDLWLYYRFIGGTPGQKRSERFMGIAREIWGGGGHARTRSGFPRLGVRY